ncbi:uncharacterized protein moto isoform X2 [Gouania willdenowi]|nr:meiosis-specific coiled-coil domain-containing protein MEIOC isoform X2 [Gouania willdenowi]
MERSETKLYGHLLKAESKMDSGSSCVFGSSVSSISSVRQQDHYTKPFGLWNNDTPRKLIDSADWDRDRDLQGLVSNILEEENPKDIRYNGGLLPTGNSIWAPKTTKEDHLVNFESGAKPQHIPPLSQNYTVYKPLGNSHFFGSPKLPPGLPLPNTGNSYQSQIQQSPSTKGNVYFADTSDIFKPQTELSNLCSDLFSDAHYALNNRKSICDEQNFPNDFDQFVSSLHSLMTSDHNTGRLAEHPSMQMPTAALQNEESIAEPWKIINSAMLPQSTPGMPYPNQPVGEFGRVSKDHNAEVMKPAYKQNDFQDAPDLRSRNTATHQEKVGGVNMNQYLKSHIQQSQSQNNKSQVQKQKQRLDLSAFPGEDLSRRPQTNGQIRAADKQPISKISYPVMQSQRFDGRSTMIGAGNTQQLIPLVPANDRRRHSSMHYNANLSSWSSLPIASSVSSLNAGNVSASETASFNRRASDLGACGSEGLCPSLNTAIPSLVQMTQGEPVNQFLNYLEECFEQGRWLEKERKRTEAFIMKTVCGKKVAVVTISDRPKHPQNHKTVKQLLVNQKREQAKVSSLLNTMEREYNTSLLIGIHTALVRHKLAISVLQSRCQEDVLNIGRQQLLSYLPPNKDATLVNIALKELLVATRKLRTALHSALQMIMPKPVNAQDNHVKNMGKYAEMPSSPRQCDNFEFFKASKS